MHVLRWSSIVTPLLFACGAASPAPASVERADPSAGAPSADRAQPPGAAAPVPSTPVFGSIDDALAGSQRSDESRARDVYRHPRETLAFFDVTPGKRVVELWPGRGWYTEVLAPLLHDQGSLRVVSPEGASLQGYRALLASRRDVFDRVEVVGVDPKGPLSFGPDGSADVVLTFRNLHNWISGGYADAVHAAVFAVLAPGGVFGVIDHRAPPGSSPEQTARSGYVSEEAEIALAQKAGFVLEARSEINANPRDTKDYPEGVWTLPPVLRLGDRDRDRYLAIGESDRMTLRFRKPAANAAR